MHIFLIGVAEGAPRSRTRVQLASRALPIGPDTLSRAYSKMPLMGHALEGRALCVRYTSHAALIAAWQAAVELLAYFDHGTLPRRWPGTCQCHLQQAGAPEGASIENTNHAAAYHPMLRQPRS